MIELGWSSLLVSPASSWRWVPWPIKCVPISIWDTHKLGSKEYLMFSSRWQSYWSRILYRNSRRYRRQGRRYNSCRSLVFRISDLFRLGSNSLYNTPSDARPHLWHQFLDVVFQQYQFIIWTGGMARRSHHLKTAYRVAYIGQGHPRHRIIGSQQIFISHKRHEHSSRSTSKYRIDRQ